MPHAAPELRVSQIIDQAALSRLQITSFILCFCVALFDGYDIGTVSSMAPLIADHFFPPAGCSVHRFWGA